MNFNNYKEEQVKGDNKGASYISWNKRILKRNDLPRYITHLTKPSKLDLEQILKSNLKKWEKDRMIHRNAVDNLINILAEQEIWGSSTQSGFIIGPRKATCFQELPFDSIRSTVEDNIIKFIESKGRAPIRYCGVGICFDPFYIYENNGRPVIYEEKEKAKKLLNLNEQEYWRIVNLNLKRRDPYIENFFGDGVNLLFHMI
ncbi:hypothetical protein [Gracilibacillus saliphilus]|uniref:hypothetical protein n=1 Tax=Gracilibacillus saliphilus TaxID=543890 RepID=UPI0013D612B3|nr:hypothetical protein [Gracilibacillus saliphilus]